VWSCLARIGKVKIEGLADRVRLRDYSAIQRTGLLPMGLELRLVPREVKALIVMLRVLPH
jgi:hypothetical protein